MPNRLFLYLTQQQMIAFHWERGRCTLAKEFSIESAATDFVAYLRTHNKNLVSLVTNLAEEGFQLDTIPYLQSKDRAAVIKRKLEQFFIRAPLTVAISLGHEKTTRRNERMLFAALNNATALDPWLNAFRIAETRLVGIYSLPLLSPVLLEKLQIVNERCIFISLQDNSIRQTFFDKGSLNFSRLAPVADSSVSGLAQSVGSEIKKLQQYLLSQRLIGRNETLSAHVLIHSDALHALKNIVLPESIRLQTHPIEALAKKLGLKTEQQDSRAHVLFLQIAAQQTPRQQFAPIELRREYLLWKSSQVILTVSGIVFLLCLLFASTQWSNLQEQQKRTLQQEMTAIEAENNYKKIVNTFPKLPVSQENLRQIINRYNEIQKNSPLPEQIRGIASNSLVRNSASGKLASNSIWQALARVAAA